MFCGIKSYNTCSNSVFFALTQPTIVLPLVYCPANDTFFEVGRSAQKSAVQVCQFATLVMETTQLVLSRPTEQNRVYLPNEVNQ